MRVLSLGGYPVRPQTVRIGGAYQFSFDEEIDGTMDVVSIQERLLPHQLCVTSWKTRQAPVKTHGIVSPFHASYSPFNKYTQMSAVTRAHTFTRKICGIFFITAGLAFILEQQRKQTVEPNAPIQCGSTFP